MQLTKGVTMKQLTHGLSGTRLYGIWSGMKNRCMNKGHPSYKHYGGRGIAVCDEWHDFLKFREWAEANGYEDKLTLDRVDNDGGYHPENCRWVNQEDQANNKRNTVRYDYRGGRYTIAELSEMSGVRKHILRNRIHNGMSVEDAASKPDRKAKEGVKLMVNTKEIKKRLIDKGMSVGDLAEVMGRSYANISSKINNKTPITLDDAMKMQTVLGISNEDFCFYFLSGGRNS